MNEHLSPLIADRVLACLQCRARLSLRRSVIKCTDCGAEFPVKPNLRAKVAAYRFFCGPLVGLVLKLVFPHDVPASGLRIRTSSGVLTPEMIASRFWGFYESAERRFVTRHLRPDLPVVELGGSIGYITCFIRRKVAPEHKVVVVEADAGLADEIRANADRNVPALPITIIPGAIHYGGKGTFATGPRNIDGRIDSSAHKGNLVETMTLADVLSTENVAEYALVADIEGAEAQVLLSDGQALSRCRQMILELHDTDVHGRHLTPDEMIGLAADLGFHLCDRHGPVCCMARGCRAA